MKEELPQGTPVDASMGVFLAAEGGGGGKRQPRFALGPSSCLMPNALQGSLDGDGGVKLRQDCHS